MCRRICAANMAIIHMSLKVKIKIAGEELAIGQRLCPIGSSGSYSFSQLVKGFFVHLTFTFNDMLFSGREKWLVFGIGLLCTRI